MTDSKIHSAGCGLLWRFRTVIPIKNWGSTEMRNLQSRPVSVFAASYSGTGLPMDGGESASYN
ncbi:UNVERIFIED_ORG: hypothetical protein ABID57_003739 [Arthrobacter sp. UYEF1]